MRQPNFLRIFFYVGSGLFLYFILITLLIYYERIDDQSTIRNYFDAIWFSLVTVTTVGYGDYYPITTVGRLIGYIFIFLSIGIYGLLIGQISSLMTTIRENKRLGFNGTHYHGHTIIVGWNTFGRAVTDQLVGAGKKVAIITNIKNDVDMIYEKYSKKDVFVLYADPNNFEFLKKANIQDSSIVFINLEDDTQKLVYILNMKKYFEGLKYVVTLDNANLKNSFFSAGVTHTISKHEISSKLLASYIFEPDVAAYSEDIMSYANSDEDHDIKQFKVVEQNPYLNKFYNHAFMDLKKQYNCVLIGISKRKDGKMTLIKNPEEDITVELGDYLIMIMNGKSLKTLNEVFNTEEGFMQQ